MSINVQRTIKYRSLENQQYSQTYNRANIRIPADNMQTDLSQSYLAMRMRIKSKTGETITSADLEKLTANDMCLSFGHEDHTYSPACMIKSAVLKRGNGQILESIPFSNIISQTMFQLTTNKERLASSNLLNGLALASKRGESITKTLSSLHKDYIEVQIPLQDIFELCRSTNFWLSETQGLELNFETENRLDLFKVVLVKSTEVFPDSTTLLNTLEMNDNQSFQSDEIPKTRVATRPKVFGASLFAPISALPAVVAGTEVPQFQSLQLVAETTQAQLTAASIVAGAHCKLVFRLASGHFFEMQNEVSATTSYANPVPSLIIFKYAWYWNAADVVEFVRLEMTPMVVSNAIAYADLTLSTNIIKIDTPTFEKLQGVGLITYDKKANLDGVFDLAMQSVNPQSFPAAGNTPTSQGMIDNKQITYITDERYVGDKFYSNGMIRLPITSRGVRMTFVKENGDGTYDITFSDIGMKNPLIGPGLNGLWGSTEVLPNPANLSYNFIFERHQLPSAVFGAGDAALVAKLSAGLTYEIDRLEVVLNQSTKNKKIPMGTSYNTYKVEPITIQDSVFDYERQFNILEPSTYNTAILAPKRGSLVSTLPNIYSYRFQVNNISNTSTDITLKSVDSDFPSGMHLDKTLDYFANSQLAVRNFFGIGGMDMQSEPVRILPLKIYSANDASNYFVNNKMFTIQLAVHSPQESLQPISEQTMYLVKSCIQVI